MRRHPCRHVCPRLLAAGGDRPGHPVALTHARGHAHSDADAHPVAHGDRRGGGDGELPLPGLRRQPAETPADPGWTALDTDSSFGRASGTGGALVVYDIQADEDGLTVTLAPLPNEADVTAFQEAEEALPAGTVDYWSDPGALVLKLENTVLSSGEIGGDDWLHDFLREQGLEYPMSTPTGAVPGSCPDFEKAAISSDGTNTTISLLPLGGMTEYQVTPLGVDGLTVSFRLALR